MMDAVFIVVGKQKGKTKMKCMYIVAVAVALVSATFVTGCEKKEPTLGEKIEQAGKDAAKATDKAATDAGKAADAAAKDVNKALKK